MCSYLLIECLFFMSTGIMSYTRNNFLKTDTMFLEFKDDLDNLAGGSSSVGDNAGSSSQPPATPTPRRRAQSRLLVLERHVVVNGRISMTIAPREEKSTFSHAVRFSQWFFVLDFNDQAMNRFVKHQMLTTFKEFRGDCQSFKKYSDLEEARANPPNVLSNHGRTRLLDRSSLTIIVAESNAETLVPAYPRG
uniref:CACTA en-spm transposon protein n=1 Tax=Cucumis melo TaxID=3656 RepID=A0A9I9EG71_CUCME